MCLCVCYTRALHVCVSVCVCVCVTCARSPCVCVCVCVCVCAVLPGLADTPSLLALWSECSGGSGGLFHTTLDRVLTHLQRCFTHTLQDTLPLSPDTGDD